MRSRDADFASQARPTVPTDPFHAFVEPDGVIGNCRIGHAARHLSRHVRAVHFNAWAMSMPSDTKENGWLADRADRGVGTPMRRPERGACIG
ncbi:MAG TPA: hypothetical protein VLK60_05135 [Variovorax sp.]|jgi:hypothetical protein|nr:hypothetical protein [Variovorax sp.]